MSPIVSDVIEYISPTFQAVSQRTDAAPYAIHNLSLEKLTKIQEVIANNNKVELRHNAICKCIFERNLSRIEAWKDQLEKAESVIKETTLFVVISEFANENGQMSWEAINKTIMKAIMEKAASSAPMQHAGLTP